MPVVVNYTEGGSWQPPVSTVTNHYDGAAGRLSGGGAGGTGTTSTLRPPGSPPAGSVEICVLERAGPVAVWPPALSRYAEHRRNWIETGDLGELMDMISAVEQEFPLDPR